MPSPEPKLPGRRMFPHQKNWEVGEVGSEEGDYEGEGVLVEVGYQ